MADTLQTTERNHGGGFWSSLPGILTGLATLATAILGPLVYKQVTGNDNRPNPPVTQEASAQQLTKPASDTPTSVQSVNPSTLRIRELTERAKQEAGAQGVFDDCLAGDPYACAEILDSLAMSCDASDFVACDTLYQLSPVDSDWEIFGATCGGRLDTDEFANGCAVLAGQS